METMVMKIGKDIKMCKCVKYLLMFIFIIKIVFSQSIHYTKLVENSIIYEVNGQSVIEPVTDWENSYIYQYNFLSCESQKILSLDMQYDWYYSTSDGTKFFAQSLVTDTLYVFENGNFNQKTPVFSIASVRRILNVFDMPKQSKICFVLSAVDMPRLKKEKCLLILDRNNYTILDTVSNINVDNNYFQNQNQDTIYKFIGDFDGFYFSSFSLNDFSVVDSCRKYKEIMNLAKWHLMDIKNGYFLIMYEIGDCRKYIAYNPSQDLSSTSIEFSSLGEKYLSPLADKMILGDLSGSYYVFHCKDGEFIKRIRLEDEDEIYF